MPPVVVVEVTQVIIEQAAPTPQPSATATPSATPNATATEMAWRTRQAHREEIIGLVWQWTAIGFVIVLGGAFLVMWIAAVVRNMVSWWSRPRISDETTIEQITDEVANKYAHARYTDWR